MSLAECVVALWVFGLMVILTFGAIASSSRMDSDIAVHQAMVSVAQGYLLQNARMVAIGGRPPIYQLAQLGGETYGVTTVVQTVPGVSLLQEVSVSVYREGYSGAATGVVEAVYQAVAP